MVFKKVSVFWQYAEVMSLLIEGVYYMPVEPVVDVGIKTMHLDIVLAEGLL